MFKINRHCMDSHTALTSLIQPLTTALRAFVCIDAGIWSLRTSFLQRRRTRSWTDWPLTPRRISGGFSLLFQLKGRCGYQMFWYSLSGHRVEIMSPKMILIRVHDILTSSAVSFLFSTAVKTLHSFRGLLCSPHGPLWTTQLFLCSPQWTIKLGHLSSA